MGNYPTNQAMKQSPKEDSSLLSQMTLHFEYNKTIPQVRASLHAKQPVSDK